MLSADTPVGVVIPARNAAAYLGEAIQSVLSQEGVSTQVVVVDDGSEDEISAIASQFGRGVHCIRQVPLGPAAARNRGVGWLATELVAFLDADDLWTDGSLAARIDAMRADPAIDAIFGHMVQFVDGRLSDYERRRLVCDPRPQPGWASGAMLVRRSVFAELGVFPDQRRAGDFLEWLLMTRRAGLRTAMIDAVVLRRRLHDRNLTRTEPETSADYLQIVRAELGRKRADEAAG